MNYKIDKVMAHSLRSLAGFCMGEYRKSVLDTDIIITTYDI